MKQVQRLHLSDGTTLRGHHLDGLCLPRHHALRQVRSSTGVLTQQLCRQGSQRAGRALPEGVLESGAVPCLPSGLAHNESLNDILEVMLNEKI